MRRSEIVGLSALLACCIVLVSCPSTTPTVTISLPGGASCTGTVGCTVTAVIAPDPNARPVLTITVCVTCDGTPLAGVTGVTGTIVSDVPIPSNVRNPTTFGATGANGCTSVRYVVRNSVLRGQTVNVNVVDTSGASVATSSVTIE